MCEFCRLNEEAFAARHTHGLGSPEHREALAKLTPEWWDKARQGRAHSRDCAAGRMTPLVRFA